MSDLIRLREDSWIDKDDQKLQSSSWFYGPNVEDIYNSYLELDIDGNGTLSAEELYKFGGVLPNDSIRLTKACIARLFEEVVTYTPVELDYKGYIDLVLALGDRTSISSISYFWKFLDIEKTGHLSRENILYFYKEIFNSLKEHDCDAPSPENVVIEVYDILSCQDPEGPTLSDLISSKQGHIITSMLLDVTGFWQYDNRESLQQQ